MSRLILLVFVIGSVVEPRLTKDLTGKGVYLINSTFHTIIKNYNTQYYDHQD
jgi:hypothetical protein